ncbi:MAG: hypothetical protein BGO98_29985 [Myxococcales bacterium 68-20]|nr:hypothetical protein [Myxococcales bacterium]OJY16319.1 MAG: hypothetical protein BGO98_29985 [Myxococcales bacterium 68-20]
MKLSCIVLLLVAPLAAMLVFACAESASEDAAGVTPEADSGAGLRDSGRSSSSDDDDDDDGVDDAGERTGDGSTKEDGGGCGDASLETPVLNGPRACGASDFGKPAAAFSSMNGGGGAMTGGTIPPGTYDVIVAERATGTTGAWRETLVVGADARFTRTRQIDPGTGNAGPVTYRSGTLSVNGSDLTLTEDCYVNGATPGTPGTPATGTVPYKVIEGPCGEVMLQYTEPGFRFTLVARPK